MARDDRLLVHIPFHYSPQRLPFLHQVVRNFQTYDLAHIDIVVDSNQASTRSALDSLSLPPFIQIAIAVHGSLKHPFDLTWVHRPAMATQLPNYDYFLYLEDDILIPWPSFLAHLEDQNRLTGSGYSRGFLRLERDHQGRHFLADFSEPMQKPAILQWGGAAFIQPKYPYCACWLYHRSQMAEFIASSYWPEANYNHCNPPWAKGKGRLFKREKAAFGMAYLPQDQIPGPHRVVLPFDSQRQMIDPKAWIYHLPGNYLQDPVSHFGKIPVDRLFHSPILWQLHPIALTLNIHRGTKKLGRLWQRLQP